MTGTHPHAHPHLHPHPEAHNARAGQGPVLVDVDDDHGALVLRTTPARLGDEIELSPVTEDPAVARRPHVAVRARPLGAGVGHAAVYPSLPAGGWRVHDPDDDSVLLVVDVPGGSVVEATVPASDRQQQAVPLG